MENNLKIDFDKKIKIEFNNHFATGGLALESVGYIRKGLIKCNKKYYDIFEKDKELFAYRYTDHYGGFIYSITISPIIMDNKEDK